VRESEVARQPRSAFIHIICMFSYMERERYVCVCMCVECIYATTGKVATSEVSVFECNARKSEASRLCWYIISHTLHGRAQRSRTSTFVTVIIITCEREEQSRKSLILWSRIKTERERERERVPDQALLV